MHTCCFCCNENLSFNSDGELGVDDWVLCLQQALKLAEQLNLLMTKIIREYA